MTSSVRFASPLASDLSAFLASKRAAGRVYDRAEFRVRSLDRFTTEYVQQHGDVDLGRLIPLWLSRHGGSCKPTTLRAEYSVARQFCLFRRRRDPRCFVPGPELAPAGRGARFLPYIFSMGEIRRLLRGTDTIHRCPNSSCPSFRTMTFRTLILVLYCTGLRLGEAVRIGMRDVDLSHRAFFISRSKGRSRWVPFHEGLARHLRDYVRARSAIALPGSPFFVKPTGDGYKYVTTVSLNLRRLFRRLGLKPSRGRRGPRPYDIRHAFAIHRLTRWYRAGVDLHAHLPWLSAYMGHDDLLGTERYLTATPELLQLASQRFATRLRRREP